MSASEPVRPSSGSGITAQGPDIASGAAPLLSLPSGRRQGVERRPEGREYTSICHPDWEPEAKTAQDRSDLTDKVELYLEAEEEIKALEELRNEIREQLLAELAVGEYKAGSHVVKVAERRQERLDTKLARSLIPTDLLPQVIKVTTYKTLNIA